MIYSMTAFARVEKTRQLANIQWEIKSVNHRFLDVQFRLPEPLRNMETELRDLCRSRLSRGKVDCTLKLITITESTDTNISEAELKNLLGSIDTIQQACGDITMPNALEILRWPGIITLDDKPSDTLRTEIISIFGSCLEQFCTHRAREGNKLKNILLEKLCQISSIVSEVREIIEGLGKERHAALLHKISALGVSINPERLEQEVAILVQRADITEEMDRLDIQVSETESALANTGPHGKRLDFLMQELNREANTLSSKSVLPHTTKKSIDMKVLIEQLREQVQNIE